MPFSPNLGLRFTRLLDANPEARADFEEMLAQLRDWHLDTLTMETDVTKVRWLQGSVQELAYIMNFIEACRSRIVQESPTPLSNNQE